MKINYYLKKIENGEISIGRTAEILKVSVYDLHRTAQKQGIRLGATAQQIEKSRKTAERLLKK